MRFSRHTVTKGPALPTRVLCWLLTLGGVSTANAATLTLTNNNGTTTVATGGTTVYRVRVDNAGSDVVKGVSLRDVLPSGTSINTIGCSPTTGNVCTANNTPISAALTSGFTLPDLNPGTFYALLVTVNVPNGAGTTLTNTVSLTGVTNTSSNSLSDTDTVVAAPSVNNTTWDSCDKVSWATNTSAVTVTAGATTNPTLISVAKLPVAATVTSASGSNSGFKGSDSTNEGNPLSWDEIRAVSSSIRGALAIRGGSGNNTLTLRFPEPVINVRLGISDLDAIGSNNLSGDWVYTTASYGNVTFNPDVLVGGGTGLPVQMYTQSAPGAPSGAGTQPTLNTPGLGNSNLKAASGAGSLNTVMGTALAYSIANNDTAQRRQGQALVYYKGPLTSLTIVTNSGKSNPDGNLLLLSDIDFCSPSLSVNKVAGSPVAQSDLSYTIPYTLTYTNTSLNKGYAPDGTVRDAPFTPSVPTPSGSEAWGQLKPQLSDAAATQATSNANVSSAKIATAPTLTNASGTQNLSSADLDPAFAGTTTNATLLSGSSNGRVGIGGRFDVNFGLNVRLKSGLTSLQTINNQATGTAVLNQAGTSYPLTPISAVSQTTATTLTPAVALEVSKVPSVGYVKYSGTPAAPDVNQIVYTINVKNPSTTLPANRVTVTDTLPASVGYVSSRPSAALTGQTLSWTIDSLPAGATASYTVTVTVPSAQAVTATQPAQPIVNTASASGDNALNVTANATVQTVYSTLFKQVRNLGPASAPLKDPAWGSTGRGSPGDILEYCIDFKNLGSAPFVGYTITDPVPRNTSYVADSARTVQGSMTAPASAYPNATNSAAGGTVSASLGTLNPAAAGSFCFRTKIN